VLYIENAVKIARFALNWHFQAGCVPTMSASQFWRIHWDVFPVNSHFMSDFELQIASVFDVSMNKFMVG